MFIVVFELSGVFLSVTLGQRAESFCLIFDPVAFIHIAIGVNHAASATFLVVGEVPFIHLSRGPHHGPPPMNRVIGHAPLSLILHIVLQSLKSARFSQSEFLFKDAILQLIWTKLVVQILSKKKELALMILSRTKADIALFASERLRLTLMT